MVELVQGGRWGAAAEKYKTVSQMMVTTKVVSRIDPYVYTSTYDE